MCVGPINASSILTCLISNPPDPPDPRVLRAQEVSRAGLLAHLDLLHREGALKIKSGQLLPHLHGYHFIHAPS